MTSLSEADVGHAALDWLVGLGCRVSHNPGIALDSPVLSGGLKAQLCWSGGCETPGSH